jgi:hypothetical protein
VSILKEVAIANDGVRWTGWAVLVHSARTAVTAVASMLVAQLFRLPEAYWAPITTLVITQSSLGAAFSVSWQRFVGTMLGAVVGAIVVSQFGPHVLVFGTSVFILGLVRAFGALGSNCISVRGRYFGGCAVGAAEGPWMANRLSSVRRSVHRNWDGANLGVDLTREESHSIGEKLNSSFIPSDKKAPRPIA